MGAVLRFAQTLITSECCKCGMVFAMPEGFNAERLKHRHDLERNTFYCPAGHPQHYLGETEEHKLKRQLEAKERELEAERRRQQMLKTELHGAKVAAGKAKGALDRAHQRGRGGLCPCCKRSFTQLRRHMANKHPEFGKVEPT